MSSHVGKQLGSYSLLSRLGEGGFAEVYLGEHIYLKTRAAIKVLHSRLMSEQQEAFLTEARSIARLKHVNIIRVLEFGIEGEMAFLVMDYAPHGSLRALYPPGTRLPLADFVPYVGQAAAALQYAHRQQLIHRDVKPENMLLGVHNTLLLGDFGMAQVVQQTQIQHSQKIVGTIMYMAPEQLQGRLYPASDQYALGAVVYEWLSGEPPFRGSFSEIASQQLLAPPPSFQERGMTVAPAVEAAVMKALAKEPEQRFASIQAFATALQEAQQPSDAMFLSHAVPSGEHFSAGLLSDLSYQTRSPSSPLSHAHSPANVSSPIPSSLPTDPVSPVAQEQLLPQKWPPLTIAMTLMIVLLLMIGSSGLTYYVAVMRPAYASVLATATAQARQALLLKQSQAAEEAAHQRIYLQATSGEPAYSSSLQTNDSNLWSEYDIPGQGSCAFTNGAYHVTAPLGLPNTTPCYLQEIISIDNFAIQVEMTIIEGDVGGIRFRESPTATYLFVINHDGSYNFSVETFNGLSTLLNGISSAIVPGLNHPNLITIIARGSTFDFYVNKQYIAEAKDSASSAGRILLTAKSNEHESDVAFSHAQIWKL